MSDIDYHRQTVIVTGASSGLGAERQDALSPVQRPGHGRGAHLRKEAPDG
ncbi:hypothetical protein ACFZBP_02190 [Streptomyces sp. NPDC008086]